MRGKNIARFGIALALSVCLLSGCASKAQWAKPGFNPDEFKQDLYLCGREANIMASQQAGAMSSAVNPLFMYAITKKKFFNNCMEAKGYEQIKGEEEKFQSPTKPQIIVPQKPITSAPVTPSSSAAKIVTVIWTFANIRSGVGNEFPVVMTVKQGDKLRVVGEYGEWFNVRLEDGKEGWISSRVVK